MTTTDPLTVEEVAKKLRCSKWTVYQELASGALRGSKPRKVWLIPPSAVQEYLAAHSNEPKTEQAAKRRRRRAW